MRRVIHEAAVGEQVRCCHRNMDWAVLATAGGNGQIRRTCLDCGYRERHCEPYNRHPARDTYALVIPGTGR